MPYVKKSKFVYFSKEIRKVSKKEFRLAKLARVISTHFIPLELNMKNEKAFNFNLDKDRDKPQLYNLLREYKEKSLRIAKLMDYLNSQSSRLSGYLEEVSKIELWLS